MNNKKLHIICILFFFAIGVYSVMTIPSNLVPRFILFSLLYLLNMQVRYLLLKGELALLSLIIELIIVLLLGTSFGGLIYLLTFITLIYGTINIEKYLYGISVVSLIALVYLLKDRSIDYIVLNIVIYTAILVLLMTLLRTSNKVNELEHLYDDVRRYSYELENTKKQVEAYSKRVEELTQLEERNRISEEIHDTIGHRLTALLIQMEAGIRVMDLDTLKGRELIVESRDNLRESIDVLRETVRGMKPKAYRNFLASIEDMLREFEKKTSVNVVLSLLGTPVKLYPGVEIVLYRNLQESLTNSIKHGKSQNIDVTLKYIENTVALTVKDDGIGCSEINKGMGILGMEERTSFVGGSIRVFSNDGFILECIVPANN
ncbi:MAG: two-component sensor histidine kinase [Clostridiales bacterium]|nr:two-component sensor histidine kinase [Clostridiales bacterium]